ncbi:hypothetical protein ACFL3T_03905 [Patescibacteria group bacterium]
MQRIVMLIIAVSFIAGCDLPKAEKEKPPPPKDPPIVVKPRLKEPDKPKCPEKLPQVKALKRDLVLKVLRKLRKVGPSYPSKHFVKVEQAYLATGISWRMVVEYKDRRYTIFSNVGTPHKKKSTSFLKQTFVSVWVRWKGHKGVSTFSDRPLSGVVHYGNYGNRYYEKSQCKGFKNLPYFHLQYRQFVFDLAKILRVSVT